MRSGIPLLFVLGLGAGALPAQAPPAPPGAGAMDRLAFLVGEWAGPASMQMGPRRADAWQREWARREAGGTVLAIRGLGRMAVPGRDSVTVHDAFAVIWYEAAAGRYRMRAFTSRGNSVETEPDVGDGRVVWGFDDERLGRVRYTVTVRDERWVEIGESRREGGDWAEFFRMDLRRTAPLP